MAEPLAQALGTDLSPFRDTLTSKRRAEEAAGGLVTQAAQARGELAGLERGMEAERGAQRQAALTGVAEEAERKRGMLTQPAAKAEIAGKLEQPFVPSKANAEELAGLFSLINVVGLALGAGGKRNAMAAMSAMNGMAEGYQRGRQDVYKREKDQFDTNLKQLKQRYDVLDKEFKEALDLIKTDKEAGLLAADQAFAKAGADFYRQYSDKYGLAATYELHKQTYDAAKRATEKAETELRRAEEANLRARAEQQRLEQQRELQAERLQQQRELQQERLAFQREGRLQRQAVKAEKPVKAPTDVEKAVRGNATFLDQVEGIVDRAEKLAKAGKIEGIGVLKGLVPYEAAQLYMSQEEKDLLQDFSALTNQKLKDQSGATVTGAEFARQRGVLPLRNDEIQTVIGKLKNWRRLVAEETAVIGKAYPSDVRKYGIVLDVPKEKAKMVPGMVYRTRQGNLLWNGTEFVEQEE